MCESYEFSITARYWWDIFLPYLPPPPPPKGSYYYPKTLMYKIVSFTLPQWQAPEGTLFHILSDNISGVLNSQ